MEWSIIQKFGFFCPSVRPSVPHLRRRLWNDHDQNWQEHVQGIWRQFYHTMIYHQFVRVRVREEPHWQGASISKAMTSYAVYYGLLDVMTSRAVH